MINNNSVSICVPIIAQDYNQLKDSLTKAINAGVSLIEYRRDYLQNKEQEDIIYNLLNDNIHNVEIIFTFRHYNEGGQTVLSEENRFKSIYKALEAQCLTYLDIEESFVKNFLSQVNSEFLKKVKLIVSAHNFKETPSKDEILDQLRRSNEYGDIIKVAYQVNSEKDLENLNEAAKIFRIESEKPLIIIGMGELGKETRIYPERINSNLTFAPLDSELNSAPGQLDYLTIKQLRESLTN